MKYSFVGPELVILQKYFSDNFIEVQKNEIKKESAPKAAVCRILLYITLFNYYNLFIHVQ